MRAVIFIFFWIGMVSVMKGQTEKDSLSQESIETVLDTVVIAPLNNLESAGSLEDIHEIVRENFSYPEEAKKNGIEGRVFVSFIVQENGDITDVEVVKGLGYGCDEEAVRLIKLVPGLTLAVSRGKPSRTRMVLPVIFRLGDEQRE